MSEMYTDEEKEQRQKAWEELMKDASKVGDVVKVTDEVGVEHNGLVTAVHGPACINVVYLSADPAKRDPYGQQMERLSSLQKKSVTTAPRGRFYEVI